ncbi:hypothetical protein UFOVP78_57 [uncultured Caudovirales phage]|uniref:Uncharacterized protein n=1 Tax=uncultured Caudovirales phage TaxID=2100421 RepID=A0A6J5L1M4_9CAUD|nr:hypothetical protein UFOVP78_57 [uncultured Caudovirales phage]
MSYTRQVGAEPVPQPRVNPGAFGQVEQQAAQGLAGISQQFAQMAIATREAQQTSALSAAQTRAVVGLEALRTQIDREADPTKIAGLWAQGTRDLQAQIEAGISDRAVRAGFQNHYQQQTARYGREVATIETRRTADVGRATLAADLDQLTHVAGQGNDESRAAAVESAHGQITRAVAAGYLTHEQAQQMGRQFASGVDTVAARQMIDRNPAEALKALREGGFGNLAESARLTLTDRAEAGVARAEARAEAALARRERQIGIGLQQINGLLAAGYVPEDQLATLKAQSRGTAYEPVVARMEQDAREVGRFAALSTEQQVARINQLDETLRGRAPTEADLALRQRLGGIVQHQQQDLNTRGLSRAVADGVVAPLPAFDPSKPEVVNQYAAAAQAASAHYGRPVSMLTEQGVRDLQQQFTRGSPEQRLATVLGLAGVSDPAVRGASLMHLERARGDAGRLPAGALLRIADMARGGLEGQRAALELLTSLGADVSDRAKQMGEAPELRSALVSAQTSGMQAILARQAQITGDARFAATVARDMDAIGRHAATLLAGGETSPARAVQRAQELWNTGMIGLDVPGLGAVRFPASQGSAAQVGDGLRRLREYAVTNTPIPDNADEDTALSLRQRQQAIRMGEWTNQGNQFALVSRGAAGAPVVLATATMDQVMRVQADSAAAERVMLPARRREEALDRTARERRAGERLVPVPVPEMR